MSMVLTPRLRAGSFVFSLFALMAFALGCSNSSSKTTIRFVNASPSVVSVNAVVDGVNLAPQIGNLGGASAYLTVASGSRHIQIEDATTSTVYIDDTLSLGGGTATTFLATGLLNGNNLTPLVLTDDHTAPVSGAFKMRVINGAPPFNVIGGPVDAYVVPSGTVIGTGSIPTFSGLSFPSPSTTYVSNTAGSFQVIFTVAGNPNAPVATSAATTYSAGQVSTMVLVEDQNGGPTTTQLNDVN